MRIIDNQCRVWCLFFVLGAGLVLFRFTESTAWAASSPTIETMAYAELDRLMTSGSGHYLFFFTAAWCGHCKEMLPTLNDLYRRFRQQGVRFVGISVDAGSPQAMERVLEKSRADFAVYWVGDGVVDELRLIGIPMIFLVKNGQLVDKIPGKCSYRFLEGKILDFIK